MIRAGTYTNIENHRELESQKFSSSFFCHSRAVMRINNNVMNYTFDGSRVFFTSDTHFNHTNIIRFCDRPFGSTEEMNEKLIGNHDLKNMKQGFIGRFEHVAMEMRIEIGKQKIYLNHYPFLCFEGGYKDVWQLFGHVHTRKNNTGIDAGRLQYLYPTQYDVGVDNNDFMPVSFEQVKKIIEKQVKESKI